MMKKMVLAGFLAAVFVIMAVIVSGAAHGAEVQTGQIYVKVLNSQGQAVENASVELIKNTSQTIASGTTNKTGVVIFSGNIANFTGIMKISADGYKTQEINITYNNTKAYTYNVVLHYASYKDAAKGIYESHKLAVVAGGAVVILIIALIVMSVKKKVRW